MCGNFGFVTFKTLADAQVAMGLGGASVSVGPNPDDREAGGLSGGSGGGSGGGGGDDGGRGGGKGKGKRKGRKAGKSSEEARDLAATKSGWHMAAVKLR